MSTHEHEVEIELLLQHRAWLRALAARLVGPGLADDLAQETWVAALRRPPDPARPAKPWLAAVAKRLALRLRRRTETGAPGPEGEAPSTDELLERVELETRLAREVARLAEPFRRTVLLRYHAGLSAAEIARRDGVPAGTVRWRLKRGLDELRGRLDREFGDRKSWAALLAALAGVEGVTGGVAMSAWAKVAGAAALAAVLAAGGARWLDQKAGPSAAPRDAQDESQVAAAAEARSAEHGAERGEPGAAPGDARREVERGAPAAAQVAPRGLAFEIVEWDEAPGADLLVALRSRVGPTPGEPLAVRADAAGRVAFPEAEGRVEIAVERRSAKPYLLELEVDGGEHRLELPRGGVVSGRVLVGGEVPEQPLELELHEEERTEVDSPDDQGARVARLFEPNPTLHGATDAAGAFAFLGLEEGWRGFLRTPLGYVPRGRVGHQDPFMWNTILLTEPREGIEVDLDRCPSVRGRVVDQDGVPVPHAITTVVFTWLDGTNPMAGVAADAQGRFEAFAEERDFRSVGVEVADPSSFHKAWHEFAHADVPPDGDLGDLRLAPGRSLTLRVTDVGGRPIEGALISKRLPASDARGELVVPGLPLEETSVWVSAPGFAAVRLKVPEAAEALDVVLAPANELELAVHDRAGNPLAGVEVEIAADGPCFSGTGPDSLTRETWMGEYVTTYFKSTIEGPATHCFRTNDEGRVTVSALRPGMPLRVTVRSTCFVPLAEKPVEAPAAGEQREVDLEVEAELHDLAVRVVDQAGDPVDRASLVLSLPNRDGRNRGTSYWRTDMRGTVTIPRLTRDAYRIEVTKEGHLTLVRDELQLPDGDLELVLERGFDVVVRVKDTAGRTVPGGRLECDVIGKGMSFYEVEDGRYDLLGLPDSLLELSLFLAGATYTLRHDPRLGDAEFVVPLHGSAVVSWTAPPGADWSNWMRIVLVPEDEARTAIEGSAYNLPSGEWSFPVVLPGIYEALLDGDIVEEGVPPIELTRRTRIEVRAGETARVELVPLAVPAQR